MCARPIESIEFPLWNAYRKTIKMIFDLKLRIKTGLLLFCLCSQIKAQQVTSAPFIGRYNTQQQIRTRIHQSDPRLATKSSIPFGASGRPFRGRALGNAVVDEDDAWVTTGDDWITSADTWATGNDWVTSANDWVTTGNDWITYENANTGNRRVTGPIRTSSGNVRCFGTGFTNHPTCQRN